MHRGVNAVRLASVDAVEAYGVIDDLVVHHDCLMQRVQHRGVVACRVGHLLYPRYPCGVGSQKRLYERGVLVDGVVHPIPFRSVEKRHVHPCHHKDEGTEHQK